MNTETFQNLNSIKIGDKTVAGLTLISVYPYILLCERAYGGGGGACIANSNSTKIDKN